MWDQYKQNAFSADGMKTALAELWRKFIKLDAETIEIESQLREGYSLQDFLNWVLDPSHFRVASALTFDNTDLYLLSPGQKGIVLLMLYLAMDKQDTRPLIIDQPEDNLDNLSVFTDLIDLFRERKQHRQIIVITHNPNLVVNTDADQIVIAKYDGSSVPRITYSSGSLENMAEHTPDVAVNDLTDGIIEQVCRVLEGGPTAFRKRSNVYSMSPKIPH